jgi:coenzyme Q-binding protein COQ10
MPKFEASRPLLVSPEIAFQVAADVGQYHSFLPLLERSTIRGARSQRGDETKFRAELVMAYGPLGLREAFVSAVTINAAARTVAAVSTDGPFKRVDTLWRVTSMPSGSSISIVIDYALHSSLLQMAVTGLMPQAVERLMAAFEARAREVASLA